MQNNGHESVVNVNVSFLVTESYQLVSKDVVFMNIRAEILVILIKINYRK